MKLMIHLSPFHPQPKPDHQSNCYDIDHDLEIKVFIYRTDKSNKPDQHRTKYGFKDQCINAITIPLEQGKFAESEIPPQWTTKVP